MLHSRLPSHPPDLSTKTLPRCSPRNLPPVLSLRKYSVPRQGLLFPQTPPAPLPRADKYSLWTSAFLPEALRYRLCGPHPRGSRKQHLFFVFLSPSGTEQAGSFLPLTHHCFRRPSGIPCHPAAPCRCHPPAPHPET